MNSVHQWRQHFPQHDAQDRLQNLFNAIQELRKALRQRRALVYNDPQIDEIEEGALMHDVEDCLRSAENIADTTMKTKYENHGPFQFILPRKKSSHTPQRTISPPSYTPNAPHLEVRPKETECNDPFDETIAKHRGSIDSDSNSDPEPDFQEGFPPTVYSALIAALLEEFQNEFQAGNYQKAEKAHCKAIQHLTDREAKLKIPFENRNQMNETLADIYVKQNKFDKAKNILNQLLRQEKSETDLKWRLYHTLAEIHLAQGRLPDAEKFAKRAYIGREKALGKGHALIVRSAELLVLIYEKQGETQAAQAFRTLYPNEKIVAHAPQISKHVGTKRVAWNPDLSIDINALMKSGKTLLISAILSGDDDAVQQILQSGADLESRCVEGISPLMHAAVHGQERIAGVLLSRGVQVDATTAGWTALQKATDQGDWKMAQILLENHADIETRGPKDFVSHRGNAARRESDEWDYADEDKDTDDEQGWTPLLRAADTGREPMVHLLLDRGANIESCNPSNSTPLSCAAEHQHAAVVNLLLLRGANANTQDNYGWSPLHRAQVHRGGDEVALHLLNHSANVDARCIKGKTPLHYAIERSNESMIRLLLQSGADLAAKNIAGQTPLHTAIECRLEGMVHLLLECGADASIKDRAGDDALAAANHALRRSPEIVKLLGKHVKARKKEGSFGVGEGKTERVSSAWSSTSGSTEVVRANSSGSWWSRRGKKPK